MAGSVAVSVGGGVLVGVGVGVASALHPTSATANTKKAKSLVIYHPANYL